MENNVNPFSKPNTENNPKIMNEKLSLEFSELSIDYLFEIAVSNEPNTIQLYYKNNINVLFEGEYYYSPLILAVSEGNKEVVKLFVQKFKADINLLAGKDRNYTALDCAIKTFSFEESKEKILERMGIYKYLVSLGARSGKDQRLIMQKLCRAAAKGDNEKIKELMSSNHLVSINQTVSDAGDGFDAGYLGFYSPLMLAVIEKKIETVKLLIEQYGADPNLLNGRGLDNTVLKYAVNSKYKEMITYLKLNGAVTGNYNIKKLRQRNSLLQKNIIDLLNNCTVSNAQCITIINEYQQNNQQLQQEIPNVTQLTQKLLAIEQELGRQKEINRDQQDQLDYFAKQSPIVGSLSMAFTAVGFLSYKNSEETNTTIISLAILGIGVSLIGYKIDQHVSQFNHYSGSFFKDVGEGIKNFLSKGLPPLFAPNAVNVPAGVVQVDAPVQVGPRCTIM